MSEREAFLDNTTFTMMEARGKKRTLEGLSRQFMWTRPENTDTWTCVAPCRAALDAPVLSVLNGPGIRLRIGN